MVERLLPDVPYAALFADRTPVSTRMLGELMPAFQYERTPPVYFDVESIDAKCRLAIERNFSERVVPPLAISLIEFSEALLFGQGAVALPDGRLLHESVREFINHNLVPDGALETEQGWILPRRNIERLTGRTLLVKRPWYRNYGHWLVDLMPIIPLVARHGVKVDTIVFGEVPDGAIRTSMNAMASAFLPGARVAFVGDERQIRCEHLLYVTPTHIPPIFMHPLAMQLAADAARAVSDESPAEASLVKLYVSRERTGVRRISNADAVEASLRAAGYETVYPENLSFSEQVALFSRATMVAGVKGAALANVTFCRPGTQVLVLSPANFPDPFFWDLATPRGMVYAEIFSAKLATLDATPSRSDFEVDLASLGRYLSGERNAPSRKPKPTRRFGFGGR